MTEAEEADRWFYQLQKATSRLVEIHSITDRLRSLEYSHIADELMLPLGEAQSAVGALFAVAPLPSLRRLQDKLSS